jgi:hypothetical protein
VIVPVLRHVADRLGHATTGYNALRASVPKDAGDAAPPAARVLTAADQPLYALGPINAESLADGPALLVTHHSTQPPADLYGRWHVTIAIRYTATVTATFARDAYQALWVVQRSLVAPVVNASMASETAKRNGVDIFPPSPPVIAEPPAEGAADAYVPALLVTYPCTSPWSLGAA